MFLADLHVHTNWSDGTLSLREVVDLYGERGFGAIAVTDHLCEEKTFLGRAARLLGRTLTRSTLPAYYKELREEAARAFDQYGMILLPGLELTKNSLSAKDSAHILAIGRETATPADLDVADAARLIRAEGALAIAAHPVHTRRVEPQTYAIWSRRHELATAFDAWEVASGPYFFDEVAASRLPKIASSDLHHRRQITSWKTELDCELHPEAILDAVRRQEVRFRFYSAEVA